MFHGIDNITQNILHIQIEYGNCWDIFCGIFLVPHKTIMDMNNAIQASQFLIIFLEIHNNIKYLMF